MANGRSSSSDRPSRVRSAPNAAAKKASAKKSASSSGSRVSATTVGAAAVRQLAELAGRDVEGVTSLAKNDDGGWQVEVEVVESRRIPDTTDLMALYEVQVDTDGHLTSYRRLRRYSRGQAGAEQGPG